MGVGKVKDDTVLKIDEYRSKANLIYLAASWKNDEVMKLPSPKDVPTDDKELHGKFLHLLP